MIIISPGRVLDMITKDFYIQINLKFMIDEADETLSGRLLKINL